MKKNQIIEGNVLIWHTSKSIDLGTGKEFDKYDEYYLITNITKDNYVLFNFQNQKTYKYPKYFIHSCIDNNKIEISEEMA